MNIYVIPAILAFLLNSYLLLNIVKSQATSKAFVSMVLIFLVHHTAEILSFIEFIKDGEILYVLKVYYASTLAFLVSCLIYSKDVCKLKIKHFNALLLIPAIIISALILLTDLIIEGAGSINYVMTAIKGPFYFIFQFYVVTLLLSIIILLLFGYKKAENHNVQIQCGYILLAFTPILITGIGIIVLMSLGFKLNAVAIIPIATTLFLMITMKCESQHKLTDIRRYMPFSPERKTSQEIIEIYSSYTQDKISYRDCMSQIERLLVINKYNRNGNNASATAKLMGMPRSSLYSIFNRLKIDVKDQ